MVERVLLLSYAFPPMALPEAILSAKRMGNLPGVTTDVLTVRPWASWLGDDRSLLDYVEQRFATVTRIDPPRVMTWLPLGRLGPVGRLPDPLRLVNRGFLKVVAGLDLHQYDAIVTCSQWHSVHLVGLALRRQMRRPLPWVAHFSDPWSANPFLSPGKLERAANEWLEGRVFAAADRLVFTSQETLELSLSGRPSAWRGKAHVLPHAFDPVLYPPASQRSGPIVLRYLGAFYGPRTPEPLFAALVELERLRPGVTRDMVVEIIGPSATEMFDTASARDLPPGLVRQRPSVDYVSSLALMRSADVLLVVDAPAETSVFLPSKLVDYLGAERAIVALTPPGAAADLVRRVGGWVADPRDAVAGANAIGAAVAASRLPQSDEADRVRADYTVTRIGAQLRDILDLVVATGARGGT